jgi:hypothetical protein
MSMFPFTISFKLTNFLNISRAKLKKKKMDYKKFLKYLPITRNFVGVNEIVEKGKFRSYQYRN